MRKDYLWMATILMAVFVYVFSTSAYQPGTNTIYSFYNKNGSIANQMKVWCDTVPVTAASQAIDISSAGFTKILSIQVQPALNTTTVASMPIASVKSWTTSSVTVNFIQSNSSVISILGVQVVGLQALQSFSNTYCHITIIGY